MSKHTQGPWDIRKTKTNIGYSFHFVAKKQNGYANILRGNDFHKTATRATSKEAEANARLIAAAPELLEALEELTAHFEQGDVESGFLDKARAAIAKAKGGV